MKRLMILVLVTLIIGSINLYAVEAPGPCYPIPSARQLKWQRKEIISFIHFTVNTYTDTEWGKGDEDPAIVNPTEFDADQWVRVVKDFGAERLILTCKHHDGFCLWPSPYTDHDIASSPWRDGKGDIVKEVSEACRRGGIEFGTYLSPWDMHEPSYGNNSPGDYKEHFLNQLKELLTNYGEISEVWWDGAKGWGDPQDYDWDTWISTVRELQPGAAIYSDAGPDCRWCGNEHAIGSEKNWCMIDRSSIVIGYTDIKYLNTGNPKHKDWCPYECDTSIRPGWFYHEAEDNQVKSLDKLIDTYYKSVGRGGVLLMNFPPDKRGIIHEIDAARAKEFGEFLRGTFSTNLAKGAKVSASNTRGGNRVDILYNGYRADMVVDDDLSTYWAPEDKIKKATLELDLGAEKTFDVIMIQEYIELGQRVAAFSVEAFVNGEWKKLSKNKTIGNKKLIHLKKPVTASRVRVKILKTRSGSTCPCINNIGLFKEVKPS